MMNPLSAQQDINLVINEILFNPTKDGFDYIELYNRGKDSVDLKDILIGNRNITNDITSLKPLAGSTIWMRSGGFAVITANEKWLRLNYLVGADAIIRDLSSLPSLPDDEGTLVLLRKDDSVMIEELSYSAKWHFPLITDPSGVALERINYNEPAGDKNNWSSAASSSGFGTPGYQNSQFRVDLQAQAEMSITPNIISPDNDGLDDFALITLNMKEPGYVINCSVYDVSGRRVCYLLKNYTLGIRNQFKWEGCDDYLQKLPRGIYILVAEVFNLQGRTKKFRKSIVITYHSP